MLVFARGRRGGKYAARAQRLHELHAFGGECAHSASLGYGTFE
jgi:hypothetical protein